LKNWCNRKRRLLNACILLNGAYDAKADTLVIASIGTTYSDLVMGFVKELAASFTRGQLFSVV
jgi:hypothetical protein